MIILVVLLSLAAVLQQPASKAYAVGIGPAEQNQIVEKHNALRRAVKPTASNMLKMEWNSAAEQNAKRWANNCQFAHSPSSQRVVDGIGCGENIFTSTHAMPWNDVIQAWYDEEKNFKHGVGAVPQGAMIGHFTQVVWYKSYQIGCYDADCPQNRMRYLYVCQYCPAGNLAHRLHIPYNAGSPCADCPGACDNGLCTNPCKYEDKYSNCADLAKKGCQGQILEWCPGSCKCPTEIK